MPVDEEHNKRHKLDESNNNLQREKHHFHFSISQTRMRFHVSFNRTTFTHLVYLCLEQHFFLKNVLSRIMAARCEEN